MTSGKNIWPKVMVKKRLLNSIGLIPWKLLNRHFVPWGFETVRIGHARALVTRLAQGERWDLVFNIAEGLKGYGRESQVPAILDVFGIPYTFSDPLVLSLCLHKGMTKHVVRDLGIPTPDFHVVEKEGEIPLVRIPFPVFVKPVAEGTGKGIRAASKVSNQEELHLVCRDLLERFGQPVVVESFLPGREFTVGIAGTGQDARVLGVMEVFLKGNAEKDAYSYANKKEYENLVEYRLGNDSEALEAGEVALAAWEGDWGVAMAGGLIFARISLATRPSSKSTPWRASTPCILTCPFYAGLQGSVIRNSSA